MATIIRIAAQNPASNMSPIKSQPGKNMSTENKRGINGLKLFIIPLLLMKINFR